MTRVMKTSWTEDDFGLLRKYADKGHSAFRIAAALRRSVASVRTMAQRQGVIISSGKAIRARLESRGD